MSDLQTYTFVPAYDDYDPYSALPIFTIITYTSLDTDQPMAVAQQTTYTPHCVNIHPVYPTNPCVFTAVPGPVVVLCKGVTSYGKFTITWDPTNNSWGAFSISDISADRQQFGWEIGSEPAGMTAPPVLSPLNGGNYVACSGNTVEHFTASDSNNRICVSIPVLVFIALVLLLLYLLFNCKKTY